MSSENLHAPRERLSQETLNLHFAIVSLMEEDNGLFRLYPGTDVSQIQHLRHLCTPRHLQDAD
jgi:hypothetical protein